MCELGIIVKRLKNYTQLDQEEVKLQIKRMRLFTVVLFGLVLSVFVFFIINQVTTVGKFSSINSWNSQDSESKSQFAITTQSFFVLVAVFLTASFCYAYPILKNVQHKNPLIKKELRWVTIFFAIVMSVYVIRAAFNAFFGVISNAGWPYWITKLL